MTRSQLQRGPAQDHYHDTLGVEETPVDSIGVQTVRLLGPFPIAFDDAGLAEPDFNGIPTLTIPAGVLVRPLLVVTSEWSDGVVILNLGLAADSEGSMPTLGTYVLSGQTPSAFAAVEAAPGDGGGSVGNLADTLLRWALTIEECVIFAGAFADTPPFTQGEASVYALVAEPA